MANLLTNDFFYSSKLGFEFEFYSNLNRNEIANELGKVLGKKVLLFNKYHSNFKPTKDIFKLEPDYSGSFRKLIPMFFSRGTSNRFLSINEMLVGSTNLLIGNILLIDLAYSDPILSGNLLYM